MSDLANHGAATSAGYRRVQLDRGAAKSPHYISRYEKPTIGQDGNSGGLTRAEGHSDVSQAAADTIALNALNGQRVLRYGAGSSVGKGSHGDTLTFDQE